jgi:hypothetical protein
LTVRADEADIDYSVMEIHPRNQPVLVGSMHVPAKAGIEHHAPVSQDIGAVEQTLDRRRVVPIGDLEE